MKKILTLLFGERVEGESIQQPSIRTVQPLDRPSETEWSKFVKFGSRYGHRGSYYENKPSVVKLVTA